MNLTEAELAWVREYAEAQQLGMVLRLLDEIERLRGAIEVWVAAYSTEGCQACEALNAVTILLDYDRGGEEP